MQEDLIPKSSLQRLNHWFFKTASRSVSGKISVIYIVNLMNVVYILSFCFYIDRSGFRKMTSSGRRIRLNTKAGVTNHFRERVPLLSLKVNFEKAKSYL